MKKQFLFILTVFFMITAAVYSQDEVPLTRDEVSALKKKLVSVFNAAGQPPEGYVVENEDLYLPTETYKKKESGKFSSASPSANYRFGSGSEQKAQKAQENFQAEYERRMAEAIAKGDYEAVEKIAEEMQQAVGKLYLEGTAVKKEPIELRIMLNSNVSQFIDPDLVLYEKPGVIALITDKKDEKRNQVGIYFDPVALKDTTTLSKVVLNLPEGGVSKKTAVINIVMELIGPSSEVSAWAKKINTGAVLSQIEGK